MTSNAPNLQPPNDIRGYVPPPLGATPGPADIQNALAGWAQRQLAEQPWYRKSANTVNAAIGGAATLAASLATYYGTQGAGGVPQWLTIVIAVLGFLGTVVGVKSTTNGFTYKGAAQVQQAILDPQVLQTVQRVLTAEPYPMHSHDGEPQALIDHQADEAREWMERNQVGRHG